MSRLGSMGLGVVVVLGLLATSAMAQHSAGWKMRYEGDTFWGSGSRGYRYYTDDTESYRSFSYAPLAIRAGDEVTVSRDDVKMMKGKDEVGAVPNGLKFTVTKVINGWLGANVEVDGQKLNGWIWHKNVTVKKEAAPAAPEAARAESSTQGSRRFSYEPEDRSGSYRTYETKKAPWQYLKTDPRRY